MTRVRRRADLPPRPRSVGFGRRLVPPVLPATGFEPATLQKAPPLIWYGAIVPFFVMAGVLPQTAHSGLIFNGRPDPVPLPKTPSPFCIDQ